MGKKGARTWRAILDIAEGLILANGFAGTSLAEILNATKLSKGAFFHYFPNKEALARALVDRALSDDLRLLTALAEQARRQANDPLKRMLLLLHALEEYFASLEVPAGSVRAALAYQGMRFGAQTDAAIGRSFKRVAAFYAALFDAILEKYKPLRPTAALTLAEALNAVIEGAALLSRAQNDAKLAARPIAHFRRHLELLFGGRESIAQPAPYRSTAPEE